MLKHMVDNVVDSMIVAIKEFKAKDKDCTLSNISFGKYSSFVKFIAAVKKYGVEMLDWQVETCEIVLARDNISYSDIEKIIAGMYIVNNQELIITNRDHFENAVQFFNDMEIDTTSTEYQPPYAIVWTIICLMALYEAKNMPITSDAMYYIKESFMEFGYTQPPLLFSDDPLFQNTFDFSAPELLERFRKFDFNNIVSAAKSIKSPNSFEENYLKGQSPIFEYVTDKLQAFYKEIKSVCWCQITS